MKTIDQVFRCVPAPQRLGGFRLVPRFQITGLKHVPTNDALLNAHSDGKQLVLGHVWNGDLAPRIDRLKDSIKELVTGFTSGNVLHAEQASGLNLGEVWGGLEKLEKAIESIKQEASGTRTDGDDFLERSNIATRNSIANMKVEAAKHWRRDTSTVDQHLRTAAQASDMRDKIGAINAANREFWKSR